MKAPHEHPADPRVLGRIFLMAENNCGGRVCSWCDEWQGLAPEIGRGRISHTICERCAEQVAAGLNDDFSLEGGVMKSSLQHSQPSQAAASGAAMALRSPGPVGVPIMVERRPVSFSVEVNQ